MQKGKLKTLVLLVLNKWVKIIWFDSFEIELSSKYNQNKIRKVVIGIAAIKPPNLSLNLAISDMITKIIDVIIILKSTNNIFNFNNSNINQLTPTGI